MKKSENGEKSLTPETSEGGEPFLDSIFTDMSQKLRDLIEQEEKDPAKIEAVIDEIKEKITATVEGIQKGEIVGTVDSVMLRCERLRNLIYRLDLPNPSLVRSLMHFTEILDEAITTYKQSKNTSTETASESAPDSTSAESLAEETTSADGESSEPLVFEHYGDIFWHIEGLIGRDESDDKVLEDTLTAVSTRVKFSIEKMRVKELSVNDGIFEIKNLMEYIGDEAKKLKGNNALKDMLNRLLHSLNVCVDEIVDRILPFKNYLQIREHISALIDRNHSRPQILQESFDAITRCVDAWVTIQISDKAPALEIRQIKPLITYIENASKKVEDNNNALKDMLTRLVSDLNLNLNELNESLLEQSKTSTETESESTPDSTSAESLAEDTASIGSESAESRLIFLNYNEIINHISALIEKNESDDKVLTTTFDAIRRYTNFIMQGMKIGYRNLNSEISLLTPFIMNIKEKAKKIKNNNALKDMLARLVSILDFNLNGLKELQSKQLETTGEGEETDDTTTPDNNTPEESGVTPVRRIEDLFAPRDIGNPVPTRISSHAGFNRYMEDILNAYPVIVIGEDRPTEEDLFVVYEHQESTIQEIRQALNAGLLDILFSDMPNEDLGEARQKLLNKLQYEAMSQGDDFREYGLMADTLELIQNQKNIQAQSAELARLVGQVPREGGNIAPEDVYTLLNNENPERARILEFDAFIEDMIHNYDFYRATSRKENMAEMYRRYKHSRSEEAHFQRKMGFFSKIKARWKARFNADEDNADDVARFAKSVYLLQDTRIVKLNRTDSLAMISNKREQLAEYLIIARDMVEHNQNPEECPDDALKTPSAKEGFALFKTLYRPYTDIRALDADMQEEAIHHQDRTDTTFTTEKEDLTQAQKTFGMKAQQFREVFDGDRYTFHDEVRASVATKKLGELSAKLKQIKPASKPSAAGEKVISLSTANRKNITEAQALFTYIKEIFDNIDSKELITDESRLVYKRLCVTYVETMLKAGSKLEGEMREALSANIQTYKDIVSSTEITYREKIEIFNALISELENQLKLPSLQVLERVELNKVIAFFTELKTKIPNPLPQPSLASKPPRNSKKK